jgi:hypothetical protein
LQKTNRYSAKRGIVKSDTLFNSSRAIRLILIKAYKKHYQFYIYGKYIG